MKKSIIVFLALSFSLLSCGDNKEKEKEKKEDLPPPKEMFLDAKAEEILDGMSKNIGQINSCSFTLHTAEKKENDSIFLPTKQYDVYFRDSNKLHAHVVSENTEFSIWFNGTSLKYFNYLDHTYDSIHAPGRTMQMISQLNEERGFYFPGADFFSTSLTDDLVQLSDSIIYIGDTTVADQKFSVIKANNKDLDVFLFINATKSLPGGMFFNNKTKGLKYKSMFMNWKLDSNLPDVLFEFSPPSHAEKITLKNI